MKKFLIVSFLSLSVLFISLFVVARKQAVNATNSWSKCTPIEGQCGTNYGTQEKSTDPIVSCPLFYHYQNNGNWNQRCHRNFNWIHPEHKAPNGVSCPEGYTESGENENTTCTKVRECRTEEVQYDACTPAGQCSEECGITEPYEVPDGQGGFIQCEVTEACPVFCEDEEALNYKEEGACTYPPGDPVPAQTFTHPSTTTAFQCSNSDIDAAPQNYHIARRPTEIDVRWWWPALGDSANIYLREVGGAWESSHNDVARTQDFQEVTLYLLDPLKSYEVGLEIKNGCGGGTIAVITDPVVQTETIFANPFWEVI